MALFGSVSTLKAQLAHSAHFAEAFAYLEQALTPGTEVHRRIQQIPLGETQRVEIGKGVFALEQAYETKPRAQGRWEAHRALIDLQAVVSGVECMEVVSRERLRLTEDLLDTRDVCFFADHQPASRWLVEAGEVAVFFPVDAHMPSLALKEAEPVRKTVVKVPLPA